MTIFHVTLYSLRQAVTQNILRINELRSICSNYNHRSIKYKVSINSFPDNKHLLQENHPNMLELYVEPQLEEFQPWIIFQQDGAPPHWGSDVRRFLEATFPNRWIGRDGPTPWPPRSPDITPLNSFYGGMLRTKCFRQQFQILQI